MKGASTGFSMVSTCFRLAIVFILCPLAMCIVVSSFTSWMPSQNEPNVIQGSPLSSITKLGSIAFQLSRPSREHTIAPSSFQVSSASSDRADISPIADVFLPNVEQLYAIHHLSLYLI